MNITDKQLKQIISEEIMNELGIVDRFKAAGKAFMGDTGKAINLGTPNKVSQAKVDPQAAIKTAAMPNAKTVADPNQIQTAHKVPLSGVKEIDNLRTILDNISNPVTKQKAVIALLGNVITPELYNLSRAQGIITNKDLTTKITNVYKQVQKTMNDFKAMNLSNVKDLQAPTAAANQAAKKPAAPATPATKPPANKPATTPTSKPSGAPVPRKVVPATPAARKDQEEDSLKNDTVATYIPQRSRG